MLHHQLSTVFSPINIGHSTESTWTDFTHIEQLDIYIQAMYKQCPHCCSLSLCSELTMWRGELCAGPFTVLHSIHTLESWGLFVASEATGLQLNKLGGPIMLSPSSTFHPSSHFMLPQHPVQLQLPLCPSIHCTQPCIYCYKCL